MHGIKIKYPLLMSITALVVDFVGAILISSYTGEPENFGDFSFPIVGLLAVLWLSGFVDDYFKLD